MARLETTDKIEGLENIIFSFWLSHCYNEFCLVNSVITLLTMNLIWLSIEVKCISKLELLRNI